MHFLIPFMSFLLVNVASAAPSTAFEKRNTAPSTSQLVQKIHSHGAKGENSIFFTKSFPRSEVSIFVNDAKKDGGLGLSSDKVTTWTNAIPDLHTYESGGLSSAEVAKFTTNYSAALGRAAKGVVYVITGKESDDPLTKQDSDDSFWFRDELPELQRNSAVTEIIHVWQTPTFTWKSKKLSGKGKTLPPSKAT